MSQLEPVPPPPELADWIARKPGRALYRDPRTGQYVLRDMPKAERGLWAASPIWRTYPTLSAAVAAVA